MRLPPSPWRVLRESLQRRTSARRLAALSVNEPWFKTHTIMTMAGHKPSGLANALGGYLCACRQSSWSYLDVFGPYGGCATGWADARAFLHRYGVPSELTLPDPDDVDSELVNELTHEFMRRNDLCRHDTLCRKYGCPDDPSWKGDRA